jgi:hypothetical protein
MYHSQVISGELYNAWNFNTISSHRLPDVVFRLGVIVRVPVKDLPGIGVLKTLRISISHFLRVFKAINCCV